MNSLRILTIDKDVNSVFTGFSSMTGERDNALRTASMVDSDVDVCVLLETPSYMTRAAIKEELEILFDREVDVVSLSAKMSPAFKESIENEAIYV